VENRYPSASSNYEWGRYNRNAESVDEDLCGSRKNGRIRSQWWALFLKTKSDPDLNRIHTYFCSWQQPIHSTIAHLTHATRWRNATMRKKKQIQIKCRDQNMNPFFYMYRYLDRPSLLNFKSFTICKFSFCMVFITFVDEFLVRGAEC
jgi:hypothetical protein